MAEVDVRDRLAIALDVDDLAEAVRIAKDVKPHVGVAKVGLELYSAVGPDAITALVDLGFRVFADIKLHDIPTTVGRAARVFGALGVSYLNFHAAGGDLEGILIVTEFFLEQAELSLDALRCRRGTRHDECREKVHHDDAAIGRQLLQDFIRHVARMIGHSPRRRMGKNHGCAANIDGGLHGLDGHVRDVDQHA